MVGLLQLRSQPTRASLDRLRAAVVDSSYVSMGGRRTSSVHEFYRYPARFSPLVARSAIDAFSLPGEVVIDPFLGGGTSVVEAQLAGRHSIGADISSLAVFIAKAKTRRYRLAECQSVLDWSDRRRGLRLDAVPRSLPASGTREARALFTQATWRVARLVGLALDSLDELTTAGERMLARCAILRTAQWALDMSDNVPSVDAFRRQLSATARGMAAIANEHRRDVTRARPVARRPHIVCDSASQLSLNGRARAWPPPRLVLTSPPYPGVYVNYHRWKVDGRKETAAPFWIANSNDGHGISYYTMGARADRDGDRYFNELLSAWSNIGQLISDISWVVQVVGFYDRERQLPRYLETMRQAGFREVSFDGLSTAADGRLWREIPGRRWWVTVDSRVNTAVSTAKEVLLVHERDG